MLTFVCTSEYHALWNKFFTLYLYFIVQVITVYDNTIGCEENHHGIQEIKSGSDCKVYTRVHYQLYYNYHAQLLQIIHVYAHHKCVYS